MRISFNLAPQEKRGKGKTFDFLEQKSLNLVISILKLYAPSRVMGSKESLYSFFFNESYFIVYNTNSMLRNIYFITFIVPLMTKEIYISTN